jgi:nucleoid DNA-binding protein
MLMSLVFLLARLTIVNYNLTIRKDVRKMNKQDLIDNIATKAQITKKMAKTWLDTFSVRCVDTTPSTETVTEAIQKGDVVQLTGFGTFKRKSRAARAGRNPQTGKPIQIPAKLVPAFSPGKEFKDAVQVQTP